MGRTTYTEKQIAKAVALIQEGARKTQEISNETGLSYQAVKYYQDKVSASSAPSTNIVVHKRQPANYKTPTEFSTLDDDDTTTLVSTPVQQSTRCFVIVTDTANLSSVLREISQ